MKILLSPAKSINFDINIENSINSQPIFLDDSQRLIKKLNKLSSKKIGKLMKVSDAIADLNHGRFQDWNLPFTSDNAKSAADIFTGAAYQGLDYPTLSTEDRVVGQDNLRILSGLYGILKPLDLMQAYRLEMGIKFKNTSGKNLYEFWGDTLNQSIAKELDKSDSQFLINLASNEYFKAVKAKSLSYQIVTPVFKDFKNGQYKIISFFAKKARGLMSRYIIQNRIEQPQDIKSFDLAGYKLNKKASTDNEFVFTRKQT